MAASLTHALGRDGRRALSSAADEGTNGKRGRRRSAPASPSAGEPVIVLRDDADGLHLPAQYLNGLHMGMSLNELLRRGGTPARWPTLCGSIGDVFVFDAAYFHRRDVCPCCRETESSA